MASISWDGRFVSFMSEASNLVSGDDNGLFDHFVHDLDWISTTTWASIGIAIT